MLHYIWTGGPNIMLYLDLGGPKKGGPFFCDRPYSCNLSKLQSNARVVTEPWLALAAQITSCLWRLTFQEQL